MFSELTASRLSTRLSSFIIQIIAIVPTAFTILLSHLTTIFSPNSSLRDEIKLCHSADSIFKQPPTSLPNLWDIMSDGLRWSWYNKSTNNVHNKCNVLDSSQNRSPPPCPWKNCLPWNQSLVPKRLGTAGVKDPTQASLRRLPFLKPCGPLSPRPLRPHICALFTPPFLSTRDAILLTLCFLTSRAIPSMQRSPTKLS